MAVSYVYCQRWPREKAALNEEKTRN